MIGIESGADVAAMKARPPALICCPAVAPAADHDLLGTPEAGPAAVRGGVLRVVGYGVGVLLTVGSAAVLFRHLGVDDSGRYVLVLALVTLFGGVTDAGLSTIAIRELSTVGGMERGVLLRNLLGLRILFTIAGVALACGYAVVAGWDRVLVAGTAIAGIGLLAVNVQNALASGLIADLRLGWVTLADALRQAVTAAAIVALALAGASLLPFFTVTVAAGLAALALTLVLVRGIPLRPALAPGPCRALLRDALPFALAAAVGAVYFRLALVLVDAFADERETGYFGTSFRVVEVLLVVPQLAVQTAFPIFSRAASNDRDRLRYGLGRTLEVALLVGVLVAVGLGVGAPFVIDVIAGPGFGPAADVLRLHAIAFVGSFAGAVYGYALLSLRRNRAVLAMNGTALLTMAVVGSVLVPLHGAQGGAAATVICEIVFAGAGAILLTRTGAVGRLGLSTLPRLLACAALGVAAAALLDLPALVEAVLAVALCAGAALVLRAVPEELLIELRRRRYAARLGIDHATGSQVALALRRASAGGRARRAATGAAAHDQRRAGRGSDRAHARDDAARTRRIGRHGRWRARSG